jgi:hypothetical protein
MKKKQNKPKGSMLPKAASQKNKAGHRKKEIVPLYPPDLSLSEKWYTYTDLEQIINVKRGVIYGYTRKGILRLHNWGGTVRFNKAYVDWMFENGGKKFTWFGWLLAITHSFDYVTDLVPCF